MQTSSMHNPALTVALSLAVGTLSHVLASRLQLPSIVLLLVLGVVLGPELLGLVHPGSLDGALLILVGFAVAVIVFEGGMNLQWRRVQREDRAILRLVAGGSWITALGGALAARFLLGWSWPVSSLFGTLVIVTGPTVVTPLLRRLRIEHSTATVLEAEGVLIDPVGAIIASSALEVVLAAGSEHLGEAVLRVLLGLGVGSLVGIAAGFALAALLRIVPEELRNVLTLSLVFTLFHGSNALLPESGLAVVTVAGVIVGNKHPEDMRELFTFKEQLTLMLIGMLFVLLAADVQLATVRSLGVPGLLVVAALMFVVRPLNVALSTLGTSLDRRKRAFVAWIAPRGIVAAAMASLFSAQLEAHHIAGARELRAMVFLVIAATVVSAGLTGGMVARWLGLQRKADVGWVILGCNELARLVARLLKECGEDVVSIDTDPHACMAAQEEGLRVLNANGLEPSTLQRAHIDTRAGAIGLLSSTEVNMFFTQRTKEQGKLARRYAVVGTSRNSHALDMMRRASDRVMFGQPADVDHWNVRLRRNTAATERWKRSERDETERNAHALLNAPEDLILPLIVHDGTRVMPVDDQTELKRGDEVIVLVNRERAEEVVRWRDQEGFALHESGEHPLDERTEKEPATQTA